MAYQPKLFIGIGETFAFFTLRETYQWEIWGRAENGMPVLRGIEERSFHHFNLSQDAEEAFEKAMEYSRKTGMPMVSTLEGLKHEMRDIKRRTAEEMEEAERLHRLAVSRGNLGYAQDRDALAMSNITKNGGIHNFAFGKYAGQPIKTVSNLDRGYLVFLTDKLESDDNPRYDNSLLLAQMKAALAAVEPRPESKHFGTEGKRVNGIEATITGARAFWARGYSYYQPDIQKTAYTLTTDAGEVLVLFTQSFLGELGEKIRFNAMIKEHSEYRGELQTIIQRPTKVEVLEEVTA